MVWCQAVLLLVVYPLPAMLVLVVEGSSPVLLQITLVLHLHPADLSPATSRVLSHRVFLRCLQAWFAPVTLPNYPVPFLLNFLDLPHHLDLSLHLDYLALVYPCPLSLYPFGPLQGLSQVVGSTQEHHGASMVMWVLVYPCHSLPLLVWLPHLHHPRQLRQ